MKKQNCWLLLFMVAFCGTVVAMTPNIPGKLKTGKCAYTNQIVSEFASLDLSAAFAAKNDFCVFGEDRTVMIPSFKGIPLRWIQENNPGIFSGTAAPGEYYVFIAGVLSSTDLTAVKWKADGLDGLECLSLSGKDFQGKPFEKAFNLKTGMLQLLYFGIQIPQNASGSYNGTIQFLSGDKNCKMNVNLTVSGAVLNDKGDSDAWRLSRLRWLNSDIALNDIPAAGYSPVNQADKVFGIDGRTVELGKNCLPVDIRSFFNESNTAITEDSFSITNGALKFIVDSDKGVFSPDKPLEPEVAINDKCSKGLKTKSLTNAAVFETETTVSYDGFCSISIKVTVPEDLNCNNIELSIPFSGRSSLYAMGMGLEGGKCPETFKFKWDVLKHQDAVWIGGVNGGLMFRFKGSNYERPLVNAYYDYKPLKNPDSWNIFNNGTVSIKKNADGTTLLQASTGAGVLKKGTYKFLADMYVTPFKVIDTEKQWKDRYYHQTPGSDSGNTPDIKNAKAVGANIINVHHNRSINPFINYPYNEYSIDGMNAFIREAHANGQRVKLYYTTRELTNNLRELFMLYSLDGEIIQSRAQGLAWPVTNSNGPHPWLTEYLGTNFVPAWRETLTGKLAGMLDLAVITVPDSRWNNFYLEGLNYLVQRSQIDGLYIDDTALDRGSMQRARKILDDSRPDARIDMHSWNHFNNLAGYASSSIVFMELYPYYDRLWHGESFDYENSSPEYQLVEISGIPFGLMSEMLQDGGNQWKGLLYGMTCRKGWYGPKLGQPENVWALMDKFGMQGSIYTGWWDSSLPVKTQNSDVPVSVYAKNGKTMIVLANFSKKDVFVNLQIDYLKLGKTEGSVRFYCPGVIGFQSAAKIDITKPLKIKSSKGLVIFAE